MIGSPHRSPRMTRRRVLIGGSALAAGAAAGPGRGFLDLLGWWDDPARLERSSMEQHLAERFSLSGLDGAPVDLVLESIEELPATDVTNPEGQFAARFSAPAGTALAQDTYSMTNRRFGDIQLFISPIHEAGASRDAYEAMFNRPKVEAA